MVLPHMVVVHRNILVLSRGSEPHRKFYYRGFCLHQLSLNGHCLSPYIYICTIGDRQYYILTIMMFKSSHTITPTYLSDHIFTFVDDWTKYFINTFPHKALMVECKSSDEDFCKKTYVIWEMCMNKYRIVYGLAWITIFVPSKEIW